MPQMKVQGNRLPLGSKQRSFYRLEHIAVQQNVAVAAAALLPARASQIFL